MSVKKEFRQTCQEHVWITFNPEIILIIIIKKKLINKKISGLHVYPISALLSV